MTISHLFVCLPTLELTTFEQQVYSTKAGQLVKAGQMHYHWGQTAAKKGTRPLWTVQRISTKKQCNLCGWLERQQCGLHSFFWILSTLEICSVLEQSWKKVYSRTTTKSIPLLQPEHGFCPQNGPESDQVHDWYPNEKMLVVPVCLNDRCCFSGCASIVLY